MSHPAPLPPQNPGRRRRNLPGWAWFALIVIPIAVILSLVYFADSGAGNESPTAEAEATCKRAIEDHYSTSRDTPILEFGTAVVSSTAGDTADFYTVTGPVDRKPRNGISGSLRLRYTCSLVAERDGTWRVNDLTFSGR